MKYLICILLSFSFDTLGQVSVLTSNYNNDRNNWNSSETILNPSTVKVSTFGKLGSFPVDGQIYAQPLYVAGPHIPKRTPDVVYVATMHNSVYAFDADAPQSTMPLWTVNLGPSVPSSAMPNYSDIVPEIGILSTPVIDVSRQAIYVVAETFENGACVFRIHALSLQNGQEMFSGPTVISASATGSAGNTVNFNPQQQLQRPGLALVNGVVYVGFGSHGDEGDWFGWLLGYDASDLRNQVAALNAAPNGYGGSIWQSGRAPAIDAAGNLYVVTANGDYNGQTDFGESFLKLSTPSLSILDWYTPSDADQLSTKDWDLGSSGAILIPELNLVTGAGKSGEFFALNENSMGHQPARPGPERVQLSASALFTAALWTSDEGPLLYLLDQTGPLFGFNIVNGQAQQLPFSQTNPTVYTTFSGIAISSSGSAAATGVVWQTVGDMATSGIPGSLHAFVATDLTNELWNSDMVPGDSLGRFAKFVAPTVVNGRVYVPTFSNQLAIYGLRSKLQSANAGPQISGVVNGASFANQAVAPGEVVSIFGIGLASSESASLQAGPSGQVTTQVSGTQVFFDGVAAPLLYASSTQLTAVVPFEVQGPTTSIQVQYQGLMSAPVMVQVAAAAPALFAANGTGGGQAIILNQDGTTNGYGYPAAPGSVVTLFGTGAGEMMPPGVDGIIAGLLPLPVPLLPVSVQIGGFNAPVLYAGQAPGQVEGVIQVNAVVPTAAPSGNDTVILQIGAASSPSTVTVAVQ